MKKVAVVGIGCTHVAEHWDKSFRDLFSEAAWNCLDDAHSDKIDALYVGNMASGSFINQENIGTLVADYAGFDNIAATKIEAACGSGGAAIVQGYSAVASGLYDMVMVSGVEKMFDVDTAKTTAILAQAADAEYEMFYGASFVGLNALLARIYMKEYNLKHEDLARFAVHCHKYSKNTKHAAFKFEITLEQAMKSSVIADPLRLLDCSAIADGSAALLLCPFDRAKEFTDTPIELAGVGHAIDSIALHDRKNILGFDATTIAAKKAYNMAKIKAEDVDVVEVHDAFTILGLLDIEDMGFCKKGEAASFIKDGNIEQDGKIPTNLSGGLKARGHPVGATGVYQAYEIVQQLRGEAGQNQVDNAEIGVTQNIGGLGSNISISVFKR